MLDGSFDNVEELVSKIPREAALYLKTIVTVQIGGEWVSASDLAADEVATLHVVTAWNPGVDRPAREVNEDANVRLLADIQALGLSGIRALGRDPDSDHCEESWAVFGLSDTQAVDLGRRYGQVAVFRISESRQTVLACDGEWQVSRGNQVPIGMTSISTWINEPRRLGHLQELLDRYFGYGAHHPGFHGRHFEWFRGRSVPGRFTSDDIAAIGALSVTVPASTARTLIEDSNQEYSGILKRCLEEAALNQHSLDHIWLLSPESSFGELFTALSDESLDGVGKVVRSKLMAAKFPDLVPIRDSRVESLLNWENQDQWWAPMHDLLAKCRGTLDRLKLAESDVVVTPLRKLDVILWMEASDRGL